MDLMVSFPALEAFSKGKFLSVNGQTQDHFFLSSLTHHVLLQAIERLLDEQVVVEFIRLP